jgi:hypothetical protein
VHFLYQLYHCSLNDPLDPLPDVSDFWFFGSASPLSGTRGPDKSGDVLVSADIISFGASFSLAASFFASGVSFLTSY